MLESIVFDLFELCHSAFPSKMSMVNGLGSFKIDCIIRR